MADKIGIDEIDLRKDTSDDVKGGITEAGAPAYFDELTLGEEDKKRIETEISEELAAIEKERSDDGLVEKWDAEENQFSSTAECDYDTTFNLHDPVSKTKARAVAQDIHQAYTSVEPKFSVSPRPEYAREGGKQVCDDQQEFLDFNADNYAHESDRVTRLCELSAAKHGTGIKKKFHLVDIKRRQRKERYQGTPVWGMVQDQQTGIAKMQIVENKGLEAFLNKYPLAQTQYPGMVAQLNEGKEVRFIAKYTDIVRNSPSDKFIDIRNFFVHANVRGYEGLCNERFYSEREDWTYYRLKEEEDKGIFSDVDELFQDENGKVTEEAKKKTIEIHEVTILTKIKDSDDSATKILVWYATEKKKIICSKFYPYDGIDCVYIPFNIRHEVDGFYQPGIVEDLTDINLASDILLNFMLEGVMITNTVTPITKRGSDIDKQFLSKTWAHGVPLNANPQEVAFVSSMLRPTGVGDIINSLLMIARQADDVSKVSGLRTGRENPIDPTAPATKTLALMGASDKNVRDYLECMIPSFNIDAWMQLQLFGMIYRDSGYRFKPKTSSVVGEDAFKSINYETLIARTNIQSRAMAFDFDKLNSKRENLAFASFFLQQPAVTSRPESVFAILRVLAKEWSPTWGNIVDLIIPPLEQVQREKIQLAVQGTAMYLASKKQEADATGRALNEVTDASSLAGFINEYTAQLSQGNTEGLQKQIEQLNNPGGQA